MPFRDDLEYVISRTGHEAFRTQCRPGAANWRQVRAGVRRMAEHFRGDPGPTQEQLRATATGVPIPTREQLDRVAACPHHRKVGCGCHGDGCAAGKGDRRPGETIGLVTVYDCISCLDSAP